MRYRTSVAAMLAALLAMLLVGITPIGAQGQEGAMAVDCEGNTLELETECQFGDEQEFSVAIQIVSPPEGGYSAFQIELRWDADILEYLPTNQPSQEVLWQHCTIPVRNENPGLEPVPTSVLFGCVPFPIDPVDPETYSDVGTVLLFTFSCIGQGTSQLSLVPRTDQSAVLDTYFLVPPGAIIDPSLEGASVTCGGPAIVRPEPEVTPGIDIPPDLRIPTPTPCPPEGCPTAIPRPTPIPLSPPSQLSPALGRGEPGPLAVGGGLPIAGSSAVTGGDDWLVPALLAGLVLAALVAGAGAALYLRDER